MILLSEDIIESIKEHAKIEAERSRECCGLIAIINGRQVYRRCQNKSLAKQEFYIDENDWASVEDAGEIIMVAHSHVGIPPTPSQADLVGIENTQLPWFIVNMPTGNYTITEPSGYIAPLVGRAFSHGVLDCYTLIRDYYKQELGIELKDYNREPEWWRKGGNMYRDLAEDAGFIQLPITELKENDMILMRLASNVDNHGGVYIGDNQILHHPMTRLSSRDVYGGYWRKITTGLLRHRSLL